MKIRINPRLYARLQTYVDECDTEISGYGHFNPKKMEITEIYPLLPQVCSAAHTEIKDEEMAKLAISSIGHKINVWWHSHVNMGVTPSSIDDKFIENYGVNGRMLVTIILNKRGDYFARFDLFQPLRLYVAQVTLDYSFSLSENEIDRIRDEIEEKVENRVPKKAALDYTGNYPFSTRPPHYLAPQTYPSSYEKLKEEIDKLDRNTDEDFI